MTERSFCEQEKRGVIIRGRGEEDQDEVVVVVIVPYVEIVKTSTSREAAADLCFDIKFSKRALF
jgi:hypothetical protein